MSKLNQSLAAALAGVSPRRLRQLDHEGFPPWGKQADGSYQSGEFFRWLVFKALPEPRRSDVIRIFREGEAYGNGAHMHQVVAELLEIADAPDHGEDHPELGDMRRSARIPADRMPQIAQLRDRVKAMRNRVQVAALLSEYARSLNPPADDDGDGA